MARNRKKGGEDAQEGPSGLGMSTFMMGTDTLLYTVTKGSCTLQCKHDIWKLAYFVSLI